MPAPAAIVGALANPSALLGPLKEIMSLFDTPATRIFRDTLADINAVVGQALTPVFRVANSVMRMVGDTIASIAPTFVKLFDDIGAGIGGLKPVFETVQRAIVAVVSAYAGLARVWLSLFGTFARLLGFSDSIKTVGDVVESVAKFMIQWMKFVEQNLNAVKALIESGKLPDSFADMWKRSKEEAEKFWKSTNIVSSQGRRNTSASFQDFESYAKQARLSAFQTGIGIMTEDQKRTKLAEEGNKKLDKLVENTSVMARVTRPAPGIDPTIIQPLTPKPNP